MTRRPAEARAPRPAPLRGSRHLDLALALALALAAFALGITTRLVVHPGPPIGGDLDIWSFSAWNLTIWEPTKAPPGYPLLAAAIVKLTGTSALWAATWVSTVAGSLLAPLTYLLARRLDARPGMAMVGAGAVLVAPELVFLSQQVAPDTTAALSLLLLGLATAHAVARPRQGPIALLLLAGTWMLLVREHGLVSTVQLVPFLIWLPGTATQRAGRLGALLGLVVLAPLVGAFHPCLPWDAPWWDKVMLVLRDALSSEPSWANKAGGEQLDASFVTLALRALAQSPVSWAWVGLASLAAVFARRAERAVLWVALVPGLPALLLFSQPRHVVVVLPIAAAVVAASARRLGGALRVGWLGAALGLAALGPLRGLDHELQRARWLSELAQDLEQLGARLCELGRGGYWAGELRAFTFCPLPNYSMHAFPHASLWKVTYAAAEPQDPPWQPLPIEHELFWFYQLEAPGPDARPCAESEPAAGEAYWNILGRETRLEPPCLVPPPRALLPPGPPRPRPPDR